MTDKDISTDRRSFLKSGAIAAAPLAVLAPAVALADDGSRAKLARLEDERAIERLHRAYLRRVNSGGDCTEFLATAQCVKLESGLQAVHTLDHGEHVPEVSEDRASGTTRHLCDVELHTEFAGDSTIEKMARFQGQSSHRHSERRVMETGYVRNEDGWRIASVRFV